MNNLISQGCRKAEIIPFDPSVSTDGGDYIAFAFTAPRYINGAFSFGLLRNKFTKGRKNMKASVAIQVLPAVDSEDEVIRIVDEVIAYIKSTGLNCYVGPFETAIEGESYDELMEIVANCQKVAIKAGSPSVSTYVKIVYNPEGEVLTIDKKVSKHH